MATAIQRPSVDRTPSFDPPRSRSTPPFATYDGASPPIFPSHSRTSSFNSSPSFFPSYITPSTSFYSSQPFLAHPVFPHQPSDFAAWTQAYQQMVMASVANGGAHAGGITPPPTSDHYPDRRRTSSGPGAQPYPSVQPNYFEAKPPSMSYAAATAKPSPRQEIPPHFPQPHLPQHFQPPYQSHQFHAPQQPFHPYKRQPSHRPSQEHIARPDVRQDSRHDTQTRYDSRPERQDSRPEPRNVRQESRPQEYLLEEPLPPSTPRSTSNPTPPAKSRYDHARNSSDSSASSANLPIPRVVQADRKESFSSDRSAKEDKPKPSSPLVPGPIASQTNTTSIAPTPRPSPLSQSPMAAEPTERMKSSGGLKGRLRRALDKDTKKATPLPAPKPKSTLTSPSETSTRSSTPPSTPPQDLPPPTAPFAYSHQTAMNSEVSLAETERTATAGPEKEKGKRGLFRMKNMSTDNISLSSTVSSASMMIRKMGSIGKLARRNSLMGISKIFKDKPKDEDASLPQTEGKKKKDKKAKKGVVAPAETTHTTAELDTEDRTLAGLSPAAKLARQHTLKAKQAQDRTGEPTWDQNTATRQNQSQQLQLPSIASTIGPEVVHITPTSRTATVVTAVTVDEHEYDSLDDSSDGETVEDVGGRRSLHDDADREFQATWGNAFIDKNAVPKKSILKSKSSFGEEEPAEPLRQRSNSTQEIISPIPGPGPLSQLPQSPEQVDGLAPTSNVRFESTQPYQNPALNTSAPALSLIAKPQNIRAMTVPNRRRLVWAPECAVYSTYDAGTLDTGAGDGYQARLEMPIHPSSRAHTHYFA
ncbi:hypothetical protein P7C73_g2177, partial [Tremellales sp. Uapishka_1]